MQDYNFILQHIPGKTDTKADILLRKDQVDIKNDNKNIQVLKEELWTRRTMVEVMMLKRNQMTVDNLNILEEICRNNTREKEIQQALKKEDGLSWEQDRIAYIQGRIYVPNNKRLKKKILWENHNVVDVRHPGQQRMMELLKQNYWWPGLKEDVKRYIQGCFKYQQNKIQHQKKSGELYPLEILQGPWQEISINIVGQLPKSNRIDVIVVIVDQFTKMI